jgi:hypothetical protein
MAVLRARASINAQRLNWLAGAGSVINRGAVRSISPHLRSAIPRQRGDGGDPWYLFAAQNRHDRAATSLIGF